MKFLIMETTLTTWQWNWSYEIAVTLIETVIYLFSRHLANPVIGRKAGP
jgi:hypothetical protein